MKLQCLGLLRVASLILYVFLGFHIPQQTLGAGYVVEWGWDPSTASPKLPKQILSNAVAVSAGNCYCLALTADGTVTGWGADLFGRVTGSTNDTQNRVHISGTTLSNIVSVVAARNFSLGLRRDGTVVTWGENYAPAEATNIIAIAAEYGYSWVLRRDGTIFGWASQPSSHDYGQLLTVPTLSNVIKIAVGPGGYYSTRGVALKRDGMVVTWGGESIYRDASPPESLTNVIAIAAGSGHTLAVNRDGKVIGWGYNRVGQATGVPNINPPHMSVGQVSLSGALLTNVTAVAANSGYSLALKKDGTVVSWGRMVNDLYPVTVPPGLSNVVAIAAGYSSCLAITTNKRVADRFR